MKNRRKLSAAYDKWDKRGRDNVCVCVCVCALHPSAHASLGKKVTRTKMPFKLSLPSEMMPKVHHKCRRIIMIIYWNDKAFKLRTLNLKLPVLNRNFQSWSLKLKVYIILACFWTQLQKWLHGPATHSGQFLSIFHFGTFSSQPFFHMDHFFAISSASM